MTEPSTQPLAPAPDAAPPAPSAPLLDYQSIPINPPVWNANAAACWSILFSPAFGAFLVAKNWDTLGFPDKARHNRIFAWVLIAVLIAVVPIDLFVPAVDAMIDKIPNVASLLLLLAWYFGLGKPQVQYIKQSLGPHYQRRPWGKPILLAIAVIAGYFIYAFALSFAAAFLAPPPPV